MNSIDVLIQKIKEKNNPTVAGLDPKLDYIPSFILDEAFEKYGKNLKGAAKAILKFNTMLIDELYDIIPAVKPQSAYYEMYGYEGVKALYDTIAYAKSKGLYVIVDGKRNDIGATSDAYSTAYLGATAVLDTEIEAFSADSLTVNGYLGTDGIKPFLKDDKSIFVLVKTSNPSSGELQDLALENGTIYEKMGSLVEMWGKDFIGDNGYSNVGTVVGATYPRQITELRSLMPHTFFLVPGYGAQGGKAEDVALAFDNKGIGGIINASRSIMCAYKKVECDEKDFAKMARVEALKMKEDINKCIK